MDILKCVYIVQVSMCGCRSVAVVSVSLSLNVHWLDVGFKSIQYWWCCRKSRRIGRAIKIYPMGTINGFTKFHGNSFHVWRNIKPQRLLTWLKNSFNLTLFKNWVGS